MQIDPCPDHPEIKICMMIGDVRIFWNTSCHLMNMEGEPMGLVLYPGEVGGYDFSVHYEPDPVSFPSPYYLCPECHQELKHEV